MKDQIIAELKQEPAAVKARLKQKVAETARTAAQKPWLRRNLRRSDFPLKLDAEDFLELRGALAQLMTVLSDDDASVLGAKTAAKIEKELRALKRKDLANLQAVWDRITPLVPKGRYEDILYDIGFYLELWAQPEPEQVITYDDALYFGTMCRDEGIEGDDVVGAFTVLSVCHYRI